MLRMLGSHQLDNAAAAVAAAACLRRHGLDCITLQAVRAGLAEAALPGRFQVCQLADDAEAAAAAAALAAQGGNADGAAAGGAGPWVVLDGAHTAESAAALARTLRATFPTAPVALVLAMAEDKAHRQGRLQWGRARVGSRAPGTRCLITRRCGVGLACCCRRGLRSAC